MRGARRTFMTAVAGIALATCTLLPMPASAQVKGVEIIAPAGAGGGYDQHARAMQAALQDLGLASGVQVVNVPGAGGTIGLSQFVTARKRGTGLLISGLGLVGAIATNKSPVSLDQVTPLARLTVEYQPLVVAADSPIRTLGDLIEKFRADPGSVSWGGFAAGSPDHILYGLIVKAIGGDVAKMNYIASGAGGEMLASVLGGHITVGTGGYNEFASQIKAGKLRAIAISAPARVPGIDVPTLKEQGVDVELGNWRAVMASKDLKPAELKSLDEAVGKMARSEQWRQVSEERGWVDAYLPAADFAKFLEVERPRIVNTLKELGLAQ
jgi:putative tricarboxylic transport membrane protein